MKELTEQNFRNIQPGKLEEPDENDGL